MVYMMRDRRTHALSLGERDKCVSMPWTPWSNVQFVSFGKRLLTQPCCFKVPDISSNCCFKAVLLWHLFKPSHLDWRELAVHESVWVCIFFYTARLNMNMFQSSAKQRRETDREERNVWDLSPTNRDIFKKKQTLQRTSCTCHLPRAVTLIAM